MAFGYNVASAGDQHSWIKGNSAREEEFVKIGRSLVIFHKPAALGFEQGVVGYTQDINAQNDYYGFFFDALNKPRFRVRNGAAVVTPATGNAVASSTWSLSIVTIDTNQIVVTLNDDTGNQGVFNGAVPVALDPKYLYFGIAQTTNFEIGGAYSRVELALFIYDKILSASEQSALYNAGSFDSPWNVAYRDLIYGWHGFDDNWSFRGIHPVVQRNSAPGPSESGHPYTVYPTPIKNLKTDFGAAGDGIADDGPELDAAFDEINAGTTRTLEFDAGDTYLIQSRPSSLQRNDFMIRGRGATIKAGTSIPTSSFNSIVVVRGNHWIMQDFTIDGNRSQRTPINNADAHCLHVHGQNGFREDWIVRGLRAIESVGDGIYIRRIDPQQISTTPRFGFFGNVECDHAWRNGVSIISGSDIDFWYCRSHHTDGQNDPAVGWDWEPAGDASLAIERVNLYWCESDFNGSWAIQLTHDLGGTDDCVIAFPLFHDNGQQGAPLAQDRGTGINFRATNTVVRDGVIDTRAVPAWRGHIDWGATGGLVSSGNSILRMTLIGNQDAHTVSTGNHPYIYQHSVNQENNSVIDTAFYDGNLSFNLIGGNLVEVTQSGLIDNRSQPNPGDRRPVIPDPDEPLTGGVLISVGPSQASMTGLLPIVDVSGNRAITVGLNTVSIAAFAPSLAEGNIQVPLTVIDLDSLMPTVRSVIAQTAAPIADLIDGGWKTKTGGTSLFEQVDEILPDDDDLIHSSKNPVDDACEIRLGDLEGTGITEGFVVNYRYGKIGDGTVDLTVELREGISTIIASWFHPSLGSFLNAEQVLTPAQVQSISDFNDLRIRFIADVP